MQATVDSAQAPQNTQANAATSGLTLADLVGLVGRTSAELNALFAAARWSGVAQIEGHPGGTMLAVPGLDRGIVSKSLAPAVAWR